MKRVARNAWYRTGMKAWFLTIEASQVIGLRLARIAVDEKNRKAESERMVAEKIAAAVEIQTMALSGQLGHTPHSISSKTLAHYRGKVRANRRRLLKG